MDLNAQESAPAAGSLSAQVSDILGRMRRVPNAPYSVYTKDPTELVFGMVGGLGTDWDRIQQLIEERLKRFGYASHVIRLGRSVIPALANVAVPDFPRALEATALIELGNRLREDSGNNGILALAAQRMIKAARPPILGNDLSEHLSRNAYIIRSLKHPDEVSELRKVYAGGFFLIGVHTPKWKRIERLTKTGSGMTVKEANTLLERDEREDMPHGQHTEDTFHLADFFLADEGKDDKMRNALWRCLDLVFSSPHVTPTFNEYAMFMAFAGSLRSADMNRQVGAVVARNQDILSTGANDCPRSGGGLYWPVFDGDRIGDVPRGRDHERDGDSNTLERFKLVKDIASMIPCPSKDALEKGLHESRLADLTEFGRSVHAEMEALLACARNGVSSRGATIYTTTLPCHNCAKHIIAAGIEDLHSAHLRE